eukprot:TRINITY_DN3546_c0_g1_i1.p1 TRINITY_DN3546_c0_g1~~TRINITY_DN3546_c0_g1_i1.p1  ORF type:complete len:342 (+),score=150.42 TRINITY_DN3546_c0_g1_i1:73-1098(+)
MQSKKVIRTILGTMTFGTPKDFKIVQPRITDIEETKRIINYFRNWGGVELDTARMYCQGDTEQLLGQINISNFQVATKVFPGLKPEEGLISINIINQFEASLNALNQSNCDIFYLHWPDHSNPIYETLKTVNELYRAGKFREFGLSNYSSWQVMEIYRICKENNWVLPTVYQGMYNAVTRDVERELLPCLRYLGNIRFYAYNPLAGGILSGKYQFNDNPEEGRFSSITAWGQRYKQRYWKEPLFESLQQLKQLCEQNGITLVEASLSWLYNHSKLNPFNNDGVIIGASSLSHLEQNLNIAPKLNDNENENEKEIKKLPQEIIDAFEIAWLRNKIDCPPYFR